MNTISQPLPQDVKSKIQEWAVIRREDIMSFTVNLWEHVRQHLGGAIDTENFAEIVRGTADPRQILIMGTPGMGKSSLMHRIATEAASKVEDEESETAFSQMLDDLLETGHKISTNLDTINADLEEIVGMAQGIK